MRNLHWRTAVLTGIIIITLLVAIPLTAVDIAHKKNSCHQWQEIAKPYAFNFALWELHTLSHLPQEIFRRKDKTTQARILRRQIGSVLADNDIIRFPPIAFSLEKPPHLLVISPRDKIAYSGRMMLRQKLSIEEMEKLEIRLDELGLSSLVVELGGFGATYPPIIGDNMALTYTINTATEEWLHQYLAFRPLGFLYLLDSIGIEDNPDAITMNETLAGMVSREIGSQVYTKYYKSQEDVKVSHDVPEFDFDAEMRETRKIVDQYLSQGKIEEAEHYMEERRRKFVAHGYYIRKLNQAYFAFHSIYGHDPASISPIYEDLQQLRAQSPSLKYFLNSVASMRSYAELKEVLKY